MHPSATIADRAAAGVAGQLFPSVGLRGNWVYNIGDYIGRMEKKMETTIMGYIGV